MSQDWTIHGRPHPPDDVILDAMALPLLVLDDGCRIIRFNTPAERLTGHFRSKVVGLNCADVLNPTPCGASCPVQAVLRTGVNARIERLTIQASDMHKIDVESFASPLLGPRGKVIGAVQILRELEATGFTHELTSLPARRARQEIEAIRAALEQTGGNISKAARSLSVHRTTLWRKIKRFGIKI
jgi:transcriptional regulator with PAS, ATPase and Fis domain